MRKFLFAALLILLGALNANAACTGSGTSWSCPSGATTTDIQNALNSATDGATLSFAAGTYSWSSRMNFSVSKGATLICPTPNCNVTISGQIFGFSDLTNGVTTNKLYRISGFNFTGNNAGGQASIWWELNGATGRGTVSATRIDHNTFTINSSSGEMTIMFCGDTSSNLYCYGVIDHNTIISNGPFPTALYFPIGQYDSSPPLANFQGTANNMFLEDNTLITTTNTDISGPCMTDAWGWAPLVIRHNSITNCLEVVHDLTHAGGPSNVEVYNNQFLFTTAMNGSGAEDGYRMFHHQGAQVEIFFFNTFKPLTEPHNADTISALANYVDGACSSYPCLGNGSHGPQPGRDSAGVLRPIYVWGNTDVNNNTLVLGGNESAGTYVKENRDLYNDQSGTAQTSPTSPFNGTVGVGWGTLANRPTTCTHSNPTNPTLSPADDGHGGVGYAAGTTIGTIGPSSGAGVAGDYVLYGCSATNTWTLYYTPYTYPHPLTTGGGGTPAVSLNPSALSFGNQAQNTPSNALTVTLTNTGTATLTITSIALITGTNYTISANTCGASLGASSSCNVSIVFTPTALTTFTDTLRITTNAASSPDNLLISGNGVIPTAPARQMSGLLNAIGNVRTR